MELTKEANAYQQRLIDFTPGENAHSPEYQRAIEFAKANGYSMKNDCSYNGFIEFEKIICDGEYKFELKVYDQIKMFGHPWLHIYNKELSTDFLNNSFSYLFNGKEITYSFKIRHENLPHNVNNLDELFARTLEMEKICTEEDIEIQKKYPRVKKEEPQPKIGKSRIESKVEGIYYTIDELLSTRLITVVHKYTGLQMKYFCVDTSEDITEGINKIDGTLNVCDWNLPKEKMTDVHKQAVKKLDKLFKLNKKTYLYSLK